MRKHKWIMWQTPVRVLIIRRIHYRGKSSKHKYKKKEKKKELACTQVSTKTLPSRPFEPKPPTMKNHWPYNAPDAEERAGTGAPGKLRPEIFIFCKSSIMPSPRIESLLFIPP